MTMRGLAVDGYDINPAAVKRAIDDNVIAGEAKSFAGYDYYIISISTHNPDNMFLPQHDGIIKVSRRIAHEGKAGALVCIESTIPRGASRQVAAALAEKGKELYLVHVPHRYYSHEKANHGVNQTRVIGAIDDRSMEEGIKFYGERLGIPLYRVSSIEVAELSKIVENSYRFLEIAFAEELKMICDRTGINFDELRSAVNTKWN
ncbi:MAG: potassium transporter TrkA, partial [Nitrososphaera sp.]